MQRSVFAGLMVALSAAMAMPGITCADVATIGAAKDNTIFQSNVNNSLGAGQAIFSGTNAQLSPRRGLIDFDIAASIPAGSTINSVQLTLFLNSLASGSTASPTIHLYRLSDDWGEGTAGSTLNSPAGVGQGIPAGEGDGTRKARHFFPPPPTPLDKPRGGFAGLPSAALAIVGRTPNTPYTWQ